MFCTKYMGNYRDLYIMRSAGGFPIIVIAFAASFITMIPGIRQVLLFLGKHSMNIFLIHTFIRHYFWSDFIYSFGHFGKCSGTAGNFSGSVHCAGMAEKKYNRLQPPDSEYL